MIYRSTWFAPEGGEIATETYDKETGGVGYYLRQDGTIRAKCEYEYDHISRGYVSVQRPLYYDRNGNPVPDASEPID
ncbi:MAG: hypothetical protein AAF805_11285 [Planctomycetota bacterium]